MSHLVEFSCN